MGDRRNRGPLMPKSIEWPFAFCGIISGTARCVNTKRPLTRSLDLGEKGLAMQATLCTVPGCPDPRMIRWLPVVDYEGIYEVHSHGDVRRIGRGARNSGGARVGRVLKPHEVKGRYLIVQLWRDGKPRMRLVHLLVAAAFIGPCPEGEEVNHKSGDKHVNCAGNLEYVTRSENIRHAYRIGLRSRNVDHLVRARRKPRVAVACECGCGVTIETPDSKGRDRRYVRGHGNRKRAAS